MTFLALTLRPPVLAPGEHRDCSDDGRANPDDGRIRAAKLVLAPGPILARNSQYERVTFLAGDPSRTSEIEDFFRGCGVSDQMLELFRSWIGAPVQFYSVFISYSHADKDFADRLHNRLQAVGIRCWKDHDMRIGDRITDRVNRAARVHDRILLCCSKASLTSPWV